MFPKTFRSQNRSRRSLCIEHLAHTPETLFVLFGIWTHTRAQTEPTTRKANHLCYLLFSPQMGLSEAREEERKVDALRKEITGRDEIERKKDEQNRKYGYHMRHVFHKRRTICSSVVGTDTNIKENICFICIYLFHRLEEVPNYEKTSEI